MPPLFEVMKEPLKRVPVDGSASHPSPAAPYSGPGGDAPTHNGSVGDHGPSSNGVHVPPPSAPTLVLPGEGAAGGRQVVLTTPRLMIALAVVLGGIIVLWSIAYKLGESGERSKISAFEDQGGEGGGTAAIPDGSRGSVADPLTHGGSSGQPAGGSVPPKPVNAGGGTTTAHGNTRPGGSTPGTNTVGVGGATGTNRPTGTTAGGGTQPAGGNGAGGNGGGLVLDPRQPGLNYLIMAALTAKDAQEAIDFLKTQEIDAVAFPDRSIDPAKPDAQAQLQKAVAGNEKFWVIYAKGFPGGSRYSESEAERSTVRTKIERAGRTWQREHRGATDFAATYWQLYKGG